LFCPSSLSLLVYYADCRISKEQCYIAREPKARQLQEHIVSTITPSFSDCYLIKKNLKRIVVTLLLLLGVVASRWHCFHRRGSHYKIPPLNVSLTPAQGIL